MRISRYWVRRQIAGCLVMFLWVPLGEAATVRALAASPQGSAPLVQAQPQNVDNGTNKPVGGPTGPVSPSGEMQSGDPPKADFSQQSGTSQPTAESQQNKTSKAVGTAAAPYEKKTGVAASMPAGAVIAPAKQRRARSILIKVGVLVGAAVAIGTVAAFSLGSPSRP